MSKLYIDYKCTLWSRIHFDNKEDLNDCIEKIKNQGYIPSTFSEDDGVSQFEDLADTAEFISPNENDGQSTIECCIGNKIVWDNSYESELKDKLD